MVLICPDDSSLHATLKNTSKIVGIAVDMSIKQYARTNTNHNYVGFKITTTLFIYDLNLKSVE